MGNPVPAVLHLWRRPGLAAQMLGELGGAALSALYVNVDGPRKSDRKDAALTEEVRSLVLGFRPDYPVYLNASQKHRGLRRSIIEGTNWFFTNEPHGIVLEEDTLPSEAFFSFCSELLHRYRDNLRISQISGTNHGIGAPRPATGYYYSQFQHIWGFATWADRWHGFSNFAATQEIPLLDIQQAFPRMPRTFHRHWRNRVNKELAGTSDTWSASWNLFSASRARLSVVPAQTLVMNIGFSKAATNAKRIPLIAGGPPTGVPLDENAISLIGPQKLAADGSRDYYVGMTQWPTQKHHTRVSLALMELIRRVALSVGNAPRSQNTGGTQELTVAQKFFLRKAFPTPQEDEKKVLEQVGMGASSHQRVDSAHANLPVLVLAWKKPLETQALLAHLTKLGVQRVYVSADGPRVGNRVEELLCEQVRNEITAASRTAALRVRLNKENSGAKLGITSAVDWFFEHEECGVILEDDCWPTASSLSFFSRAVDLYAGHADVGQVSGSAHHMGAPWANGDYFLSQFCHIWGFATWREAWKGFSSFLRDRKNVSPDEVRHAIPGFSSAFYRHWARRVNEESQGTDTWDSSWNFYNMMLGRKSVTPRTSLVQNTGFSSVATNSNRLPLIAGFPPRACEVRFDGPLREAEEAHALALDRYVGLTQWNTQPPVVRLVLAAAEIARRTLSSPTPMSLLSDRHVDNGNELTVAQRYYRWKIFR